MLEMYRQDRFRQDVVHEQAAEIVSLEERIREVDRLLSARASRSAPGLRCPACSTPHHAGARFCVSCGQALADSCGPVNGRASGSCPRCGAAQTPGQRYCLDCGLPLGSGPTLRRTRGVRSPGSWVWPVLLLLVLGTLGALAAVAVARGGKTETLVATRVRLVHLRRPAPATTAVVPTRPANVEPLVQPPPRARNRSALTQWPRADGYTVVLESVPTADAATARQAARRALAKGLTQVGIIDSRRFSSLAPGFLVVFTGVFDSAASAAEHIADARRAGFQSAYEREISR